MNIKKEWHLNNKMPKNLSIQQRIEWHKEHAKNCSCREMPKNIKKMIKNGN